MHDAKIYQKFDEILIAKRNSRLNPNRDKFLAVLSYCLNSLGEDYRLILRKSYFENCYKFWWLDYFCKSSYYRKRFIAISSFVRLYEMIYENVNDLSIYLSYAR